MVPNNFYTFFATSAGAGAALIGLLFVAISIVPENILKEEASASRERRSIANNTFTAMLNAFFISLGALIPGTNLGAIVLVFGVIGLSNGLGINWQLLRTQTRQQHFQWRSIARNSVSILAPMGLYGYECILAVLLILSPGDINSVGNVTIILIAIYGWGIEQAWEMLGLHRLGLLSIFLFWRRPAEDDSLPSASRRSMDTIQRNSASAAIPEQVDSEQR